MKRSTLLALLMICTLSGYSQKVKMSKDAKEKYDIEQRESEENSEEEETLTVYKILIAESEVGSGFMQLRFTEGTHELETKGSMMVFPELDRLMRIKFSAKAEVDILNFLGELNWEVVAIQSREDKKTITQKYYLKKTIAL